MKYEARVHEHYFRRYGILRYFPSQWWCYGDGDKVHYCQTDGLLILPAGIILLEVKYNHTPEAFWQMENLYVPVLTRYFNKSIKTVEVVKWFDPAVRCPMKPMLREDVEKTRLGEFAVHILNRD